MRFVALLATVALTCGLSASTARADEDDHKDHHYKNYYSRNYIYKRTQPQVKVVRKKDSNSCIEGSLIGGLAGAGVGAAITNGSSRWIGVPLGAAAGALVGCQIDGG
ncbi:MAG: glycine zipper 2TM domain-containing protein [Synechococcaceae cyanobacterium]|jgi:outer membrane lipoprotein SlyB|nr:glycine zipper 2TM domain-containing protein [Synechococcaceae cyanobacterium]